MTRCRICDRLDQFPNTDGEKDEDLCNLCWSVVKDTIQEFEEKEEYLDETTGNPELSVDGSTELHTDLGEHPNWQPHKVGCG